MPSLPPSIRPIHESARRVRAEDVTDAVLQGAWVVDLRTNLAARPNTYVGWLVPCDDDIAVLTDTADALEQISCRLPEAA